MIKTFIRTLFITDNIPYPPVGGVSLRNWQNINIMSKQGSVAVFSVSNWNPKKISVPGVEIWKHYNVKQKQSSWENLERRFWWLFPTRLPNTESPFSKKIAQELNLFIQDFKPDVVIFTCLWYYRFLSVVKSNNCQVILDNHNVETELFLNLLVSKNHHLKKWQEKLKAKIELNHLKLIEKNFINQANQVWVCSEREVQLIKELYRTKNKVFSIPNGINIPNYEEVRLGKCQLPKGLENKERNILFLGQMSYLPNTEAADLLIDKIYPQVKKIYPDSRLLLVGRNPTEKMLQAGKKDSGIIVTGSVPEVNPYLAASSLMVVPLLKGGGTRLKIVEAFAAGCPVISTAKGAEGINAQDGEHLLIRNTVEEIVEGICTLWSNPDLGKKLADSAYELVKREFSWEAVGQKVGEAIEKLVPKV